MSTRFHLVELITLIVTSVLLFNVYAQMSIDKGIHSSYSTSATTESILKDQREKITGEMRSLQSEKAFGNLSVLTPEKNGNPFRNAIGCDLTTIGRSYSKRSYRVSTS